jgi:ribosomal protein S18 acetylase RimI-like enzyme
MATIAAEPAVPDLAIIRRLEAAGFRAWPASSVTYEGTWAVRLTAGHPAKRLNSINPLDPADNARFDERIARTTRRFDAYGRRVLFRVTPLAGATLTRHLDDGCWTRFSDSIVMALDLSGKNFDAVMDMLPTHDVARFLDGALRIRGDGRVLRPGLSEIIGSIRGEAGLFLAEREQAAVSTAICVHDGDLAGLFEVSTLAAERGRGHARDIVLSSLKWAKLRGARMAWLQVEADNEAAVSLYRSLGFAELYRYHYRAPVVTP